jgi:hypothetical protein
LLFKVRDVKNVSEDVTLAIPSSVLPGLNADFDGDSINSMAGTLAELKSLYSGFDPTMLIVDHALNSISIDMSALEGITIAMFSDHCSSEYV